MKTWKTSRDPDYAAKKARIEHLYAIADGEVIPEEGEPEVVFYMDEFGPLNLQPHPGRQWTERGGRHRDPDRKPRPRRRATYTRPHGVRHLFAFLVAGGHRPVPLEPVDPAFDTVGQARRRSTSGHHAVATGRGRKRDDLRGRDSRHAQS
ncbi:hypothetical protein OH809_42925 [Streptomyces sp. NBC_00873]|nr:hypothetical protein OH809_00785 [Streptomyces sp. NBC_00873]WSY96804.1 hypothetical protein OH809_42925 [Streptomyces sp. NBC_00873]WTA41423.1 hypothetical protein OH821_00785 [Streptomyces sp. NBC_00842]WTA48474.1 hypothetical protein OH821_43030 [Streptomyces sp. NBC_00842]